MKISKKEFMRMLSFIDSYAFPYSSTDFYAINKRDPTGRVFLMPRGEPGLRSCLLRDSIDSPHTSVTIDERMEDPSVKPTFVDADFIWAVYEFWKTSGLG